MDINIIGTAERPVALVEPGKIVITSVDDALDILGNASYLGAGSVIVHKDNLTEEFFDLKTRLAGEILQKFSTYNVRLAIVGDFSNYTSKSLRDFIYESNKGRLISFVPTLEEAVAKLNS